MCPKALTHKLTTELPRALPNLRNILGEGNRISDSTIFDFNYIGVTIPNGDAWAGGEDPLDGLTIYTDGFKMSKGTDADGFCPYPI